MQVINNKNVKGSTTDWGDEMTPTSTKAKTQDDVFGQPEVVDLPKKKKEKPDIGQDAGLILEAFDAGRADLAKQIMIILRTLKQADPGRYHLFDLAIENLCLNHALTKSPDLATMPAMPKPAPQPAPAPAIQTPPAPQQPEPAPEPESGEEDWQYVGGHQVEDLGDLGEDWGEEMTPSVDGEGSSLSEAMARPTRKKR